MRGGGVPRGLAENLSLVLGFDRLLLVAVSFYVLPALSDRRRGLAPTGPAPVAVD